MVRGYGSYTQYQDNKLYILTNNQLSEQQRDAREMYYIKRTCEDKQT